MQVPPLSPIDSTLWRLVFSKVNSSFQPWFTPNALYRLSYMTLLYKSISTKRRFFQRQRRWIAKTQPLLQVDIATPQKRTKTPCCVARIAPWKGSFRNTSWTPLMISWYHSKVAFLTVCMHSLQKDAKGKNFQASFLQCSAATTSNHNQQQAQVATTTTAATIAITTTTATSTSTSQPEPNPGWFST